MWWGHVQGHACLLSLWLPLVGHGTPHDTLSPNFPQHITSRLHSRCQLVTTLPLLHSATQPMAALKLSVG